LIEKLPLLCCGAEGATSATLVNLVIKKFHKFLFLPHQKISNEETIIPIFGSGMDLFNNVCSGSTTQKIHVSGSQPAHGATG
jgi:hypothetical protein